MPKQLIKRINNLPLFTLKDNFLDIRGVLSYSQNLQVDPATYNGTTVRPGTEITALTTSINTTVINSKIIYRLSMSYEVGHNNVFVLQRVVGASATEIASGNPAGTSAYGFAVAQYSHVGNTDSTPDRTEFIFMDEPNVPAGTLVTYRIRYYGTVANPFFLNRTANATTTVVYERSSSVVLLTEVNF